MARLWTLLALVAVLLMPLGMVGPVAMAASATATASGHCDEHQQPADAPAAAQAHCTGCVALPALDASPPSAHLRPEAPAQPALADTFSGVEPGTDPPPPKRS